MITAHPADVINMDVTTLEATKGLLVTGFMTRGVHFYCNTFDRNVAHAALIADSLVGEPARRPMHVAFFTRSDLFSHPKLSKLIPSLIAQGHVPFMFLPRHKSMKKSNAPMAFDLHELAFFERQLLQEHIMPFLRCSS